MPLCTLLRIIKIHSPISIVERIVSGMLIDEGVTLLTEESKLCLQIATAIDSIFSGEYLYYLCHSSLRNVLSALIKLLRPLKVVVRAVK